MKTRNATNAEEFKRLRIENSKSLNSGDANEAANARRWEIIYAMMLGEDNGKAVSNIVYENGKIADVCYCEVEDTGAVPIVARRNPAIFTGIDPAATAKAQQQEADDRAKAEEKAAADRAEEEKAKAAIEARKTEAAASLGDAFTG